MALLGCLGYIIVAIPLTIYRGWALTILWGWFAVPLFEVPELSIPFGIGLSLLVGFLTTHYEEPPDREGKEWWEPLLGQTFHALFLPTFALLVGWVVVQFI